LPPFSCSRTVHPAPRQQILDLHLQGGADARKAVGEGGDQGAVAQIAQGHSRNRGEQFAPFLALERDGARSFARATVRS
jgi:hypothetical protein